MINKKDEYIFIHIPKCAGSSVELLLTGAQHVKWDDANKIWEQHATAKQIKELYCQDYEQYFSFTFVRNPWDRTVSDYKWLSKDLGITGDFKSFLLLEDEYDTPRLKYPHENKHGRGDHILPQSDFVLDSDGKFMVDFIGRVETLQWDLNIICNRLGIPRRKAPHVNKTKHKHYTEYYNDETKQIVAEKYAKDIEYFEYEFGE
jgi:hypothetical protein